MRWSKTQRIAESRTIAQNLSGELAVVRAEYEDMLACQRREYQEMVASMDAEASRRQEALEKELAELRVKLRSQDEGGRDLRPMSGEGTRMLRPKPGKAGEETTSSLRGSPSSGVRMLHSSRVVESERSEDSGDYVLSPSRAGSYVRELESRQHFQEQRDNQVAELTKKLGSALEDLGAERASRYKLQEEIRALQLLCEVRNPAWQARAQQQHAQPAFCSNCECVMTPRVQCKHAEVQTDATEEQATPRRTTAFPTPHGSGRLSRRGSEGDGRGVSRRLKGAGFAGADASLPGPSMRSSARPESPASGGYPVAEIPAYGRSDEPVGFFRARSGSAGALSVSSIISSSSDNE